LPHRRAVVTRVRAAAFLILVAALAAPAADAASTLERIRSDSSIRLGYRAGAAPFSFKERDGSVRGYSVEICTRVVASIQKQLGISSLRIEWSPVDAGDRLDSVAKGKIDIECGTTTISLSRYEKVDFSLPTFVDGGSVLTAVTSKLSRFADLASHKIAFIPGTTTEKALKRQLGVIGAKADLVPVKDDRIVLVALRATTADPAHWQLLDTDFSFEPYALVLRRDDPDFRLAVNRALVELYSSGEIDSIFYRWLAGLGEPGPLLNAMFYLSTLPQ